MEDLMSAINDTIHYCRTDFRDIHDAVKAHPLDGREKFWLKQSILDYLMMLSDDYILAPSETEQNLLDVYGFIKTSCKLCGTKAYG
ncbi:unnamed protein product [Rhizopus microsporus]|uniref:Uncharacterized protein n=1 Tax=Rhizopus microsporus TaxID=58291 RepID=A0A1X0RTR2_RHIZD|nr:hypothetical protein BCV71DRAFT_266555 [Rhizopus microsporus]